MNILHYKRMEPTKTAVKRLASDIKNIIKDPLDSHGIYYKHDDEDLLKGYAMIIGPEDTPYNYGYYLFEFNFPYDYPYKPPVLNFCTNGDKIRMNPNLYRSGKVCISILNTWKGDQWSSCQTIRTILLTLMTILNDKPLLNEPGFRITHRDFQPYSDIIYYKNIEIAIIRIINAKEGEFVISKYFKDEIIKIFVKNYENILKVIKKKNIYDKNTTNYLSTGVYDMNIVVKYDELEEKVKDIYKYICNFKC